MSHYEPSSWSSLDLRTTPNTHVPVREVRHAVPDRGTLTTKSGGKPQTLLMVPQAFPARVLVHFLLSFSLTTCTGNTTFKFRLGTGQLRYHEPLWLTKTVRDSEGLL